MNSVKVGAEPTKEAQQDQGDEEEEEGDRHGGVGDDLQGEDISVLWKSRPDKMLNHNLVQKKKKSFWFSDKLLEWLFYLSFGDVHKHSKAGHVVTLTTYVAVVPVEQLTSFGGPAACPPDPNHQHVHGRQSRERKRI